MFRNLFWLPYVSQIPCFIFMSNISHVPVLLKSNELDFSLSFKLCNGIESKCCRYFLNACIWCILQACLDLFLNLIVLTATQTLQILFFYCFLLLRLQYFRTKEKVIGILTQTCNIIAFLVPSKDAHCYTLLNFRFAYMEINHSGPFLIFLLICQSMYFF